MNSDTPMTDAVPLQKEQGPGATFSCRAHDTLEGVGRFANDGEVVNGIGSADPLEKITQRYFTLALIEIKQFVLRNSQQDGSLTGRQYPVKPGNQRRFSFHDI